MRSGSAWISAIRSALSGTMFIVAMRLNVFGWTTVAVPSQLLPTTRMSWVVVRLGRFFAASADAGSARDRTARAVSTDRVFTRWIVESTRLPCVGSGNGGSRNPLRESLAEQLAQMRGDG